MITIYTLAYNEELMIQFMIDHYRERFPGCHIVVNDNMSTDNTVKIALANSCEVIPFDTDNHFFQEQRLTEIRNSCWKNAKTEWVLVCDMDELLDINEVQLKEEEKTGTTIIRSEGYDMVDVEDKFDLANMKYGMRDIGHDKAYLFNKKFIKDINYSLGAHECNPEGSVKYSKKVYKLYHYCYVNYDVTIEKYKVYSSRRSPEDIKNGSGSWAETPEQIRDIYAEAKSNAIKLR